MPRTAKRSSAAPVASQSIGSFARVSKSQAFPDAAVKKAVLDPAPKKRKASSIEADAHPQTLAKAVSFPPNSDDEAAPAKRTRTTQTAPSRTATPRKTSRSINNTKSRQSNPFQTKLDGAFKKLSAPRQETRSEVPPHLAELVDLHRAFVSTLMMRLAHNGRNVPIDVAQLTPDISRTWGKRQVTIEDIRRCIAIESLNQDVASPFIVTDYGRGKICVELASSDLASPVNEEQLYDQFGKNLLALCTEKDTDEMTDVDIPLGSLSLDELPQVAIANRSAGSRVNPLLNKGHRVLSDFRNGIAAKQQEKESKQATAINNQMWNPDGSKMSLLDRLRMKQLAKANEPLPPSGPELQRRAALNRVPDVAATVSMLSLSSPVSLPRQAFTMAAILEKLKDSLRTPVSREEGAACVRLIATEVAPEWLRVVTIGGRENVVVQRNNQPVDRVLHERVQKLLG